MQGTKQMKRIIAISLVALICLGMASRPKAPPPADDVAANKALVMDMVQMLFIDHKVDEAVAKYFAPNYIQHNPYAATGAAAMAAFFKQYYQTTPTATVKVDQAICEGDLCAVHYHSIPKPGDRGSAVVDIFRIAGGKIAEHWDVVQAVPEKSANNNTMF
jgi:predicted SnoaL-like aldol condensation-catalyzing enzyme